jgi:hypothetical protein
MTNPLSPNYNNYICTFLDLHRLQYITKTLTLSSLGIPCMHACCSSFQISFSSCMLYFPKLPSFLLWSASNRPPTLTCDSSRVTYPSCASLISLVISWNFSLSSSTCVCACMVFSFSVPTIYVAISSLVSHVHSA